ncbi:dipeptidase 1-like isoform X2 [Branchiostoma floridae x Branchiostoma belcheri]
MPGKDGEITFEKPKSRSKFVAGGVMALVVVAVIAVAIAVPLALQRRDATADRARRLMEEVPLVDGHNDWPWQLAKNFGNRLSQVNLGNDLRSEYTNSHTDIPRLRQGLVGAQFWAAYTPCNSQYQDTVTWTLRQIDVIERFTTKYPDTFQWVTTAQGIQDAFDAGKIGCMVGVEGGHSIDSSLAALRMLYNLGTRYMTITHSCNTPWADNWLETLNPTPEHNGLTDFGKLVIQEMNRLGMLVDLSHVSFKTMHDALDVTRAPVIFSHSSAYAICNHTRNVPDDVLRRLRDTGGVVMVNFYNDYINCGPNKTENTTIAQVADHCDYIRDVAGEDHVGLGADYDGVTRVPQGLEDVSTYPALIEELLNRGWTDDQIKKFLGLNLINVFKRAEEVSASMTMDPLDDLIPTAAIANETCRTFL